jgi:ABC-type bacteriocin/lantibiotic exporter with double-glycine peptidase domain
VREAMKTVFQLQDIDCGIACAAMLAGTSYDEALRIGFDGDLGLTDTHHIVEALEKLGRPVAFKKLTRLRSSYETFAVDALMIDYFERGIIGHWVVWDAADQKIRDPLPIPKRGRTIRSYLRMVS